MSSDKNLRRLYPFLYGQDQNADAVQDALLRSIHDKADESMAVKQDFFAASATQVIDAAQALAGVYRNNGRLFTMGNGGSSCDAAHIAVEFEHPVTAGRPALPAENLSADISMMTAVGNDIGFAHVYLRRLLAHARSGDGLVGLSTSGNSENLILAYEKAKNMGMVTIGLAGMSGGKMASCGFVDHCLVVPSDSIHRIQECHVAIYHILWDLVHTLLADKRGSAASHPGESVKGQPA